MPKWPRIGIARTCDLQKIEIRGRCTSLIGKSCSGICSPLEDFNRFKLEVTGQSMEAQLGELARELEKMDRSTPYTKIDKGFTIHNGRVTVYAWKMWSDDDIVSGKEDKY